jgi:molecular chaperone DnaK
VSIQAKTANRPANAKPIVGIDLGTTRSVIAHVDATGRPSTILNSEGDATTPSVVLFEDDGIVVGKEALKATLVMPDQVAQFAKREMGNELYSRQVNGQSYPPEMIQSFVLGKLRRDAETKLGMEIQQAVITVPAYFNEPKRRATMDAGLLAGLDVRAVINEPTAAAIAYGVDTHQGTVSQTILVYDLGGGTFDVSIVKVEGREIHVIATDGNAMLGGLDWDKCMMRWLDAQFSLNTGVQPSKVEGGVEFLLREAEDLKHALTSRKRVGVRLAFKEHRLTSVITRDEFEEITAHLLDRTRFTIRKLVADAGLTWIEIKSSWLAVRRGCHKCVKCWFVNLGWNPMAAFLLMRSLRTERPFTERDCTQKMLARIRNQARLWRPARLMI